MTQRSGQHALKYTGKENETQSLLGLFRAETRSTVVIKCVSRLVFQYVVAEQTLLQLVRCTPERIAPYLITARAAQAWSTKRSMKRKEEAS